MEQECFNIYRLGQQWLLLHLWLFPCCLEVKLIDLLRRKQVGETVRDLGLDGQLAKQGTPTMGGIIILSAILIPSILFARLDNVYVLLMLAVTIGPGTCWIC